MFDSHCHLQDERIYDQLDSLLSRARLSGVRLMLCCAVKEADWAKISHIGSEHSETVLCAFGVHPWYASEVCKEWDIELEKRLADTPNAAVGEIGLDHTLDKHNYQRQTEIFIRQLETARALKRPVSIHCRKAWGTLISILKDKGGLRFGGVIHSYSGPPNLIKELENLGCYISFSGSILITNAKKAHESLKMVSPHRLLVETDSPDMLPANAAGPFNEPANLRLILKRAAEILGEPAEDVALRTEKNGRKLFAVDNTN
ncbi:MAG: TatD family hydrolase [Chitinispirillales bacterium]|jgi:TatD DNase family protein|nr:TatD family hydrolase [Chitinispirillales bacterium]